MNILAALITFLNNYQFVTLPPYTNLPYVKTAVTYVNDYCYVHNALNYSIVDFYSDYRLYKILIYYVCNIHSIHQI